LTGYVSIASVPDVVQESVAQFASPQFGGNDRHFLIFYDPGHILRNLLFAQEKVGERVGVEYGDVRR